MPEISMIMPLFNKERYLSDALESVMAQTFSDFELIIIDDGSDDHGLEIAKAYAERDTRFRVYSIENQGVSHARNMGMACAEGKYITFMDADDTIHPSFIENMYTCLLKNQTDIVISGMIKHRDGVVRGEMACSRTGLYPMEDILTDFASEQKRCGIFGSCVAKLFSREFAKGIRFDEKLNLAEDFDFYLRLYAKAKMVYCDDKLYYYYRQEAENSSVQVADEQIDYLGQLQISLRYRQFLNEKEAYWGVNKEIVSEQITNYLFLSLYYCPQENFTDRFNALRMICHTQKLEILPRGVRQNVVLLLFRWNMCTMLRCMISGYHAIRRRMRRA